MKISKVVKLQKCTYTWMVDVGAEVAICEDGKVYYRHSFTYETDGEEWTPWEPIEESSLADKNLFDFDSVDLDFDDEPGGPNRVILNPDIQIPDKDNPLVKWARENENG